VALDANAELRDRRAFTSMMPETQKQEWTKQK
jgi:hypothetical protein